MAMLQQCIIHMYLHVCIHVHLQVKKPWDFHYTPFGEWFVIESRMQKNEMDVVRLRKRKRGHLLTNSMRACTDFSNRIPLPKAMF